MQVDNPNKSQSQGFQVYGQALKGDKQEVGSRHFEELEVFRNYIRQQLLTVRKELEFVLFAFTLYFVRKCVVSKKGEVLERAKGQLRQVKEALLNRTLVRHLDYVDNNLHHLELEKLNFHYQQLLDSQHVKQVYLSQFAYECLYQFLISNHLCYILNEIPNYIQIKVIQNEQQQLNYKETLVFLERYALPTKEDAPRPNTLVCKQDMYLYQTLDSLIQKKSGLGESNSQFAPIDLKLCPESNQMIFIERLKEKVVFAKNYLLKKQVDENSKPNVLRLQLADRQQAITCVECEHNAQVVLVGTLENTIIAFLLDESQGYNYKKAKQEKNQIIVQTIEEEEGPLQEIDEKLSDKLDDKQQEGLQNQNYKEFVFYGHEGAITALSLSQCQMYFISASTDCTLRLWCLRQKECLVVYKGHLNTVWALRLQQKGYYFLSGSSDKTVRLWSTDKLQSLRIFVGHQSDVTSVLFTSCMNYVISGSLDGSVRIWSIETGEQNQVFYQHCNVGVTCLGLSNNGMYLMSAGQDGSLLCWNLLSGVKVNQLMLDTAISHLQFSSDDQSLVLNTKNTLLVYLTKHFQASYSHDLMDSLVTSPPPPAPPSIQPLLHIANQTQEDFIICKYNIKNYVILLSRTL